MFYIILLVSVISVIGNTLPSISLGPLLLTPFIQRNEIADARSASLVNPEKFQNVTSYSGFLTVDKDYKSNTFFWYFPNSKKELSETPWIIWLQGGPGATSMYGLFAEMGPWELVDDRTLKLREYSWCNEFSMVFIDNPVGAGFSFTDRDEGYPRNMDMYADSLYSTVKQLTTLYPELGKAPLYIAGESYGGRYVPALAARISSGRRLDNNINLQGIMMGNPIVDRSSVVDFTRVFYNLGLIDSQDALAMQPLQEKFDQAVKNGDNVAAYHLRSKVINELAELSKHDELYNVLRYDNVVDGVKKFIISFLNSTPVRQAIHVGNQPFSFINEKAAEHLVPDFLAPVSPKIEFLLENYKVLIYCGQLDLTTPCVLNAEGRRRKWHWSGRNSFLSARRVPWLYNSTVAGYIKSGGNFTEVLVSGAGHMAPLDKPAEVLNLVSQFIRSLPQSSSAKNFEEVKYEEYNDLNHVLIDESNSANSDIRTGLIASVVINVLLLLGIVLGIMLWWSRKRHYDMVPFDDSVLSLT